MKKLKYSKREIGWRWFEWMAYTQPFNFWDLVSRPEKFALYPLTSRHNIWHKKKASADKQLAVWNNFGLYAFDTLIEAQNQIPHWTTRPILGAIDYWGQVAQHELGVRAQFAQIVMLEPTTLEAFDLLKADKFYSNINIRPMIRV